MNPSFVLSLSDASMDLDAWMHVVCLAGTDLSAHQRTWNQPGLQVGTFGACTVRWTPPPPSLSPGPTAGPRRLAEGKVVTTGQVGRRIGHQPSGHLCMPTRGEKGFPPVGNFRLVSTCLDLVSFFLFIFIF